MGTEVAADVGATEAPPPVKVFISYSRKDLAFVDGLAAALEAHDVAPTIDRTEIYAFEAWWQRIEALIAAADTVIFVLSPDAVASPICRREVECAIALNKRLAPIVCRAVEATDQIPPELASLNFIFFDAADRFDAALARLVEALHTDIEWMRRHTAYGLDAREWVAAGRPSGLLLRSPRLEEAEHWAAAWPPGVPPLSADARTFFLESRRDATRRRNVLSSILASGLVVALGLAAVASWQRSQAVEQRRIALVQTTIAEHERDVADRATGEAKAQRDLARSAEAKAKESATAAEISARKAQDRLYAAQRDESITLAEQSIQESGAGRTGPALAHALSALPRSETAPERPFVHRAEFALSRAVLSARLLHELTPARDQVNVTQFSPDGKLVATGTRDGVLSLWNAETGQLLKTFADGRSAVLAVAFSPDGRSLSSYSQYPASLVVRDCATGAVRWDFDLPQASPGTLTYSRDGTKIIAAAFQGDTRPRMFDLAAGGAETVLDSLETGAFVGLTHLSIDAHDHAFAYFNDASPGSSGGGYFVLWDLADGHILQSNNKLFGDAAGAFGEQIAKLAPDERLIEGQSTADGRQIVLLGSRSLFVFDTASARLVSSVAYRRDWIVEAPHLFQLLPDGTHAIVGASQNLFEVVDLRDGHASATFGGRFEYGSPWAISRDGRHFAAQSVDLGIHVWTVETGAEEVSLRGSRTLPRGLAFSPDATELAAWSTPSALIWDIRPDRVRLARPGHGWSIVALEANVRFAFAKRDETIERGVARDGAIFDLIENRMVKALDLRPCNASGLEGSAFAPDGQTFFVRCESWDNGAHLRFRLVASGTGEAKGELDAGATSAHAIWSPDGVHIGLVREIYEKGGSSEAEIWDVASRTRRVVMAQAGSSPALRFVGRDRALFETRLGTRLHASMWDLSTGSRIGDVEARGDEATGLPDGRLLITGARPEIVDVATGRSVADLTGKALTSTSMSLSKDAGYVLLQHVSGPSQLWRIEGPSLLANLPGPNDAASSSFTGDGRRVVTVQWRFPQPARILVYETTSARLLKTIDDLPAYYDQTAGETGRRIVVQTGIRSLEIRDIDGAAPPRQLGLAGRLYRWKLRSGDERLVTADQSGTIAVWDMASGEKLASFADAAGGDPFAGGGEATGRIAFLTSAGGVRVLDALSGRALMQVPGVHDALRAALSSDGRLVAVAKADGVTVCAVDAGTCSATTELPAGSAIDKLAFSPAGRSVVAETKTGQVSIIDAASGRIERSFPGPNVVSHDFASSALMLVAHDRTLVAYETDAREARLERAFPGAIYQANLGAAGKSIGVATRDGKVYVCDIADGATETVAALPSIPHDVRIVESGAMIFEGDPFWGSGPVTLRARTGGRVLSSFPSDWPEAGGGFTWWTVHLDPTGRYLGVITPEDRLRILRTKDYSLASEMIWGGKSFVDFSFSPDGETVFLLTGRGDGVFWKSDKGGARSVLSDLGSYAQFPRDTIAPTPDGSHLLAVEQNGTTLVVSLARLSARAISSGRSEPQARAAMSPGGVMLATFTPTGVLRVWDLAVGQVLLELGLAPDSVIIDPRVAFSPDGHRLVVGSRDGPLAVFQFDDDGSLMRVAEARAAMGEPKAATAAPAQTYRLGVVFGQTKGADPAASDGVAIIDVFQDSPAAEAGMRVGDRILTIDGKAPRTSGDCSRLIAQAGPNATIELRRGGRIMKLILILRSLASLH